MTCLCRHRGVGERRYSSTHSQLCITRRWMVNTTLRPLNPRGKTRYLLYRRLDRSRGRYGRHRKSRPPLGLDPGTVQPLACRYTDYAVPAGWSLIIYRNMFRVLRPCGGNPPPHWVSNIRVTWCQLSEVRRTQPHRRESQNTRKIYFVFHFFSSSSV